MASILFVIFRIGKGLIEMQLSKKLKHICHFLSPFLKSQSNFKHFEEKR